MAYKYFWQWTCATAEQGVIKLGDGVKENLEKFRNVKGGRKKMNQKKSQ